jgi:hypothetical protein
MHEPQYEGAAAAAAWSSCTGLCFRSVGASRVFRLRRSKHALLGGARGFSREALQNLVRRFASLGKLFPVAHRGPRRSVDVAGVAPAERERLDCDSLTTVGRLGSTLLAKSSPVTDPEVLWLGLHAQQAAAFPFIVQRQLAPGVGGTVSSFAESA